MVSLDRLETLEALLFEQEIVRRMTINMDAVKYDYPAFPDVMELCLENQKSYETKYFDSMCKTSSIFAYAMIPSKSVAIEFLQDTHLKSQLKTYIQSYVDYHLTDEAASDEKEVQTSYGFKKTTTASKRSKQSNSKETTAAERSAIVNRKCLEIMILIKDFHEKISKSDKAPVQDLDYSKELPKVKTLSNEFLKYWKQYPETRLSKIVLKTASAMPTSTMSEKAFSVMKSQVQNNQKPETIEARTRLFFDHLNRKNKTSINENP